MFDGQFYEEDLAFVYTVTQSYSAICEANHRKSIHVMHQEIRIKNSLRLSLN